MQTNQYNRQYPRGITVDLGIANMGVGNEVTADLPQGAILLRINYLTVTAFNSATTATGTVDDGTTTFVSAVDVKSVGAETVANTPKFYPQGGQLKFGLAQTGAAATAGRVIAVAEYAQLGNGDEVYG